MIRTLTFLAALLVLVPMLPPAIAGDCEGGRPFGLGLITIGTGQANSVTFYVDDRGVLDRGEWIYEESNQMDGLQRGGGSILNPLWEPYGFKDYEICPADVPTPDQLIY